MNKTEELICLVLMLAFAAVGFGGGALMMKYRMENQCAIHGCGEYSPKTGAWHWRDEKPSAEIVP